MLAEFLSLVIFQMFHYPKREALYWIRKYIEFQLKIHNSTTNNPSISLFEMRMYSQNGEDGILQYILKKIGVTNKYFVEFGVENGEQCNTRYLRTRGWSGLWMDGSFSNHNVKKEWITAENIELLFKKYKVPKNFDVLSIDIDSNDWWIWNAISHYSPRIVVIEYNSCIPVNKSLTMFYDPQFTPDGTDYFGASLKALDILGRRKGYRLVGCDSRGINAFFVKRECAEGVFSEKPLSQLYRKPQFGLKKNGVWQGYPKSRKKMKVIA